MLFRSFIAETHLNYINIYLINEEAVVESMYFNVRMYSVIYIYISEDKDFLLWLFSLLFHRVFLTLHFPHCRLIND